MALRPDRVREQREKMGMSQRQLAELCGITFFQISRYETGKSDATGDTLEILGKSLDVSVDYLLGLTDFPNGFSGEDLRDDQSRLLEAYEAGDGTTIMELASARIRRLENEKSGGN